MSTPMRRARPGDAAGITQCVQAAYRHYVDRIGKPPGPMLDDYAAVLLAHDVHVIERGGRIAGVFVLMRRDAGLLLDNLAVHPDFQGERLGRALMDFAEARATTQGFAALDLYTHALMHENIAWYARRGYKEIARVSEKGFDRVYMRKALRPPAEAPVEIRPFREDDVSAMLDVIRIAFDEYRGRLDPPTSAERKDVHVLHGELALGGAFVAWRGNRMVGCILYQAHGADLHFGRLSVLPGCRGAGIGGALVDAVEALAPTQGCTGVTLSVRLALESQQRWYAARGYAFVEFGMHEGYTRPTNMLLRKTLTVPAC